VWRRAGAPSDPRLAAGAAAVVTAVAAVNIVVAFALLAALPLVAVLGALVLPAEGPGASLGNATAATLRSTVPACVAVLGVVLVSRHGVWQLLVFLMLVSAYDAGHFLMAAESESPIPGIVAGAVCTLVLAAPVIAVQIPPFGGRVETLVLAGMVAVVAPLGQMAASLALPTAATWVGALRRLDAYIFTAPLFAWALSLVADAKR
jgi:hypothetical protein